MALSTRAALSHWGVTGARRCALSKQQSSLAVPLPRAGDFVAGALMLSVGLSFPFLAEARLPAGMSASNGNPYADVMKNRGASIPSAESLYEKGGGACGPGFELQQILSVGANCVCIDPAVCDMSRAEMTVEERSFGKKKEEKSAPAPSDGIEAGGIIFFDEREP